MAFPRHSIEDHTILKYMQTCHYIMLTFVEIFYQLFDQRVGVVRVDTFSGKLWGNERKRAEEKGRKSKERKGEGGRGELVWLPFLGGIACS